MREIKFRGIHSKLNFWVYGYYYHNGLDTIVVPANETLGLDSCEVIVKPNTIGQFTGLKDKNGVEIYEDDVTDADGLMCKVVWQGIGWKARWKTSGRRFAYPNLDFRNHKVIGNIHENPDLLSEKEG